MQDIPLQAMANERYLSESFNIDVKHLLRQTLLMDCSGPDLSQAQCVSTTATLTRLKPVGACHTNYRANYPNPKIL